MNAKPATPRNNPRYRGKKNADGFYPNDFRTARLNMGYTVRQLSDLIDMPRSTISHIETGRCQNPAYRAQLIKELKMTPADNGRIPKFAQPPRPAPKAAAAAAAADYKKQFEDLAKWVLHNCIDDLAVSYAKFALIAAARGVRV